MRCCVPDCKSDTRHTSKSQGITFHTFPKSPSIREAWLRALNKESWVPKEHSSICSIHFMAKDLYFTKSGLRKVRESAVPVIGETQKEDFANGSDLDVFSNNMVQACRMCLATDQRLYSIRLYYLEQPFERFTGLSVHSNEKLPQYICSECYHKLINADNFRRKSLRANELLIESLGKHHVLTTDIIKSIDRHQLTSNLTIKHFPPDTYNIEIEHQYIEYDPNMEYVKPDIDMTVHVEKIEPLDIRDDIFADDIKDYDEAMTGDDAISKEEKEFDTDDSLPLEVTRKKKKSKINKKLREKPTAPKIDRRRKPFLNQDLNETLFTVTNLMFEEQVAEIEKRQESDNYKHSVFKCTECYKGFLDQDAYSSHMTRHTSECGEHQCDICKTHFKQSHALRKHITAHHTQRFSCNQCTYVTTHRQTARLHERWHKGTKYKCPHCQDEFVKFTTYMGHVRIKHPSDFVCELCGYSFVSAKGIELHKKLKHRTENGPVPPDGPYCSECNVRFASVEAHRKHLAVSARHSVIEGREPNKANKGRRGHVRDKVSKKISDQDDSRPYPSHLRRAEGPIPCEQCGMQLEDSRAYHGHFRRAHPDKNRTNYPSMKTPCMCELCGRIFQSAALLKDHRWTHTGERPFKCSICDKSFRMRQRLVAHRRVHQPDKDTYMCSVCGKHFSTHSNRQRHMFIHTGLKPFKCEMCGKCFKHASEKRAHVTYVHLKKPWPKRSRGKRGGRQGSPLPQDGGTDEIVMDSVWPTCDPKLDINVMNEKSMYYNMKI